MRKNNKWLMLINMPIQMGIIIFLFAYLGQWLDEKYSKTMYVKICVLVGVAIAFYNLNRLLKSINKNSDE
jgi:uncharacterized membrane protein YfcA